VPGHDRDKLLVEEPFRAPLLGKHANVQTTYAKAARRCRHDQHRRRKTTVKIEGLLATGSGIEVCCESI